MNKNLHWMLALPFAALAACQANPNLIDEADAPIIGGVTDTADPAVVALYAAAPGAQSGSLCTAEVIAPTVLLTAAHCVLPSEVGSDAVFQAYLGPDLNQQSSSPGKWVAVKETHYDPAFDINKLESGHDVGIAILQEPVDITPLPYNTSALTAAQVGSAIRLVGYGLDNGGTQTGAGIKRQVTTTLNSVTTALLEIGDSSKETCNGDSGGPAFMNIDGRETIVGTTSYGDLGCTGGGYDTRIDRYADFIGGYVKGNGAPTGPGKSCGACPVDESCVDGSCQPRATCSAGHVEHETKPDNQSTLANALCEGGIMEGALTSAGDQAWFKLSVPADKTLTVTLDHLPADYSLRLYRLGSRMRLEGAGDDKGDRAAQTVTHRTATAGDYYIEVFAPDGRAHSATSFELTASYK